MSLSVTLTLSAMGQCHRHSDVFAVSPQERKAERSRNLKYRREEQSEKQLHCVLPINGSQTQRFTFVSKFAHQVRDLVDWDRRTDRISCTGGQTAGRQKQTWNWTPT